MARETPHTKFLPIVKGPSSDYGGDIDEELLVVASASQTQQDESLLEALIADDGTDYGTDFDNEADEEITRLLAEVDSVHVVTEPLIEELGHESGRKSIAFLPNVVKTSNEESGRTSYYSARESNGSARMSNGQSEILLDREYLELANADSVDSNGHRALRLFPPTVPEESLAPEVEMDDEAPAEEDPAESEVVADEPENVNGARLRGRRKPKKEKKDYGNQTPIERFRTKPKKPLSVTDIVSPAWCELQYWFSLTKFGRVRKTPAMRQGSTVHKQLEEQVHTYVEIEVKTREDTFGLKIWNTIQGLRTLRATGLTRELEVWGIIDGELINGIMDELSHTCPDPELESTIELSKHENNGAALPPGQKTISQFYASQKNNAHSAWLNAPHPDKKIYITDIKTRAWKHMPKGEAALRGVQMQLMLYHRLLNELASNTVNADTVFARYSLDAHLPFTTAFIGNIAELEDNFIHENDVDENFAHFNTPSQQFSELAQHNSLTRLWSLMITEFQRTIPSPAVLSEILQVEYRKGRDGKVIGSQCFVYNDVVLNRYVSKTMDWWKGKREAKGVDIEEAYKCQVCEFAPDCKWREEKVQEGVERFREKRRVGGKKWAV